MIKAEHMRSYLLSRRRLLINSITLAAASRLASTNALASPKVSQASVGFMSSPRGEHRCGNCKMFQAPSACMNVAGAITENCSCKIWLPKPA